MLGKFAHEVAENLTVEDIDNWVAYQRLQEKDAKRKKGKSGKGRKK